MNQSIKLLLPSVQFSFFFNGETLKFHPTQIYGPMKIRLTKLQSKFFRLCRRLSEAKLSGILIKSESEIEGKS